MEGQHFKKTGKLVSLSEPNLVDCSGCREFHEHEGIIDCGFKYLTNLYVYNKANIGSIKRQSKTLNSKTGGEGLWRNTPRRGDFLINYLSAVFEEQLKRFRPLRCRMAIVDRQSQLGFCSLPRYIKRNGGIDTESGYPSPCNTSCCFLKDKVGATVTGKYEH